MNYDTCPDYFRGRYLRDRGDLIQARLSAVCGHRNDTGSGTTAALLNKHLEGFSELDVWVS